MARLGLLIYRIVVLVLLAGIAWRVDGLWRAQHPNFSRATVDVRELRQPYAVIIGEPSDNQVGCFGGGCR